MGVVYEARHPQIPRPLALKRLLVGMAEPKERARFLREAQLLARVRHPNVVTVHDLSTAPNGDPFLVTDLVEGEPLDERLRRGPLEPRAAAQLVRALAGGVGAVHAQGVLHRDLKPANVIVRPDGSPVLLDFGLARELNGDRLTQTGEILGTPAFMAPEQAEGDPDLIDRRCDVYGLGAVLYAALTAEKPFHGSLIEILPKILEQNPPWPRQLRPEVPESLDAIVRLAMHKVPGGRYAGVSDLEADLARWLEGEEPLALARAPAQDGKTGTLLIAAFVSLILVGFFAALAYRAQLETVAVEESRPSLLPYEPLPEGELLTGVLNLGDEQCDGGTYAFFLGGEPRRVVAVNRIERVLRAWRVDVSPLQESRPLPIADSDGAWVSRASPHPSLARLAVLLRTEEGRKPDQAWLIVYELVGDGWQLLWRRELEGMRVQGRPRHLPNQGYLRMTYGPSGARIAVTLPYGEIEIRDAESGDLQATLVVPNDDDDEDGELRWPTSGGGLCFMGPERLAMALHAPADFGPKVPNQLYPDSFQLRVYVWSGFSDSKPSREIGTPNQAATTLSSYGDELAIGFQQHRVAILGPEAESCRPGEDLPASDEPRRYAGIEAAPAANLGHPPRCLIYTRDGTRLLAAGGDAVYRVEGDRAKRGVNGGELRWWIRTPEGSFREGGKFVDDGPVPPDKRFIHTIQLDPGERYLVVGRNDGYVQLIENPMLSKKEVGTKSQ